MSEINPAHYRTELGLAINGDWYLMRDGGVIAMLPADPGGPVINPLAACGWACAELATRGIAVTEWVNGMDRPEHDSGYWVAEPWEAALATADGG